MLSKLHKKEDIAALILRMGVSAIAWNAELLESVQAAVTWAELVGGTALLFGLLTRLASLLLFCIMIGAIMMVSGQKQFLVPGVAPGHPEGGYVLVFTSHEYLLNFAVAVMCLSLLVAGSGRLGLDHLLFGRRRAQSEAPHRPDLTHGRVVR